MKLSGKCPKCGCRDHVANAKAHSEYDLSLSITKQPEALIFKDHRTTTVSARVCLDCGFVELYADSPVNIA